MPGLTLCGDLGEWVGDGDLLNCCPEDINEPPADDFDTRVRERIEGAWVDPQIGYCTPEDVVDFLSGATGGSHDDHGDDGGAVHEGLIACVLPSRSTLSLLAVATKQSAVEAEVVYPDFMSEMEVSVDGDQVAVGSCERQGIGRYRRFAR